MIKDYLSLKWGVPKGWRFEENRNKKCIDILQKYYDLESSPSAMLQPNTKEHREVLCSLVDEFEGEIYNDWSGESYNKDSAKKYIMEYKR